MSALEISRELFFSWCRSTKITMDYDTKITFESYLEHTSVWFSGCMINAVRIEVIWITYSVLTTFNVMSLAAENWQLSHLIDSVIPRRKHLWCTRKRINLYMFILVELQNFTIFPPHSRLYGAPGFQSSQVFNRCHCTRRWHFPCDCFQHFTTTVCFNVPFTKSSV
jgi:hypothetical protein